MKNETWGASRSDWRLFAKDLKLIKDLLPVISNPGAQISPTSTMKGLGKTPSLYNANGEAVGIAQWTQKNSTVKKVRKWLEEPDYGICLQTRVVRALDIDVPSKKKAKRITKFLKDEFPEYDFPKRYRPDSGKYLLAFKIEGEIPKRVMHVKGGLIEFLATGQQFIAAGTHTDGEKYVWDFRDHEDFPTITLKDFDVLWTMLEMEFATKKSSVGSIRKREATDLSLYKGDSNVNYLEKHGHVKDLGPDGQLHIECPFAENHTQESSISATSYFPAGTGGYAQGHFICKHAHCDDKDDSDFEHAFGIMAAQFEILPPEDTAPVKPQYDSVVAVKDEDRKNYPDIDSTGQPKATLNNLFSALNDIKIYGSVPHYDEFKDEIIFISDKGKFEPASDGLYVRVRRLLESRFVAQGGQCFKPIGREIIRDAVLDVAEKNRLDSAQEWLAAQEWDGVPRVEKFISTHFGGKNTKYTRAVALYMWTALAGRVIQPGLKCDMVPILKGDQGLAKSSAIAALAPTEDQFVELSLDVNDDDIARKIKGVLVCELAELSGLRTREIESIKAFIVRTVEKWIPKYREHATTFRRRCLFLGTTNEDAFLADPTGNRRWLAFEVFREIDVELIRKDLNQLWAEGAYLFETEGLLYQDAERLGKAEHYKYIIRDAWVDVIDNWLHSTDEFFEDEDNQDDELTPAQRGDITTLEIMRDCLGMDIKTMKNRGDEMKVSSAMRQLGYISERKIIGKNKIRTRIWVKHDD